ncbi:Hypothetical protein NTJ_06847 [Nesidiocoris tenuis]|uniref:Uncharacterized protein n=1 Tax=Nesidiocoris tenuis TaxID=355587 RepID=A0ABN7APP4_9HEMI|nr:Hypothetical protein NTJ_06847 [Nesidiocoris tenuis]
MRTRSAMVHVFTMKMKLNNGVGKIKENVKQMNVMETMKTHLESQINQIQSDNIRLRAKIRNLSIRKCDADRTLGNLRSKIVVVDERMETLQSKILKTRTYHQRLKKEKDDLLEKLRNSYGTFDTIKDRITSSAKNIRNLKIEVEYKKNCLNGLCDVILGTDNEIIDSTRVIDRITRELEVAQEGRAVLENQLSEIMKKAIEDESTISSLNEKIATANVNLLALKSKK